MTAFPFRLYGQGLTYGGAIDYRIHFAADVDVLGATAMLETMAPFAEEGGVFALFTHSDGQFASFGFNDQPEESHDFEGEFLAHLRQVHARFPILEVLAMSPGIEWLGGDWERWSVAQQVRPDDGPTFNVHWPWWLQLEE